MNFVSASNLNLLFLSLIWVVVSMKVVVPIGEAVPVPTAIAAALYATCQCLQALLTKDYNYISVAPILCYT